jgi:actin related protein 2/3 complex subunit 1A/1B
VSIANGPDQVQVVPTLCLPFVTLVFLSETQILAAGHDCAPYLIAYRNGVWSLVDKIDQGTKKAALASSNTAFNKFKQMDSRAQSATTTDTEITSVHQNAIT